ncbi:MAG: RIP metalloprotease RseP [Kofleriaceae bacterium]|nr:RIP metalloprotease RseP [Kofleriaceae bacterium]MBP9169662.1 RIP metalloprotease RseP [Kofleriaceae bacterium]MBP9859446.1 RIP metalloprotease RseP [Kofleriaceae bacterium]
MSFVYFLLLVGVLVIIHEFGHFVAAKLLDVRVLRFSIGYGRPLFRIKGAETEYQLAVFPVGGYVRILGVDDAPDAEARDRGRSFANRPLWQRLVIIFAGPAANLILPVLIYFVFFAGHTELPAAVVGDVFEDSPAARAGIASGDTVLAVDGKSVRYWEELERAIRARGGDEVTLKLQRGARVFEKYVVPIADVVRKRDGQVSAQGRIGITRAPFVPLVGIIDPGSPAGRAGMITGDLIVNIDGRPVENWSGVAAGLGGGARRTNIVYLRGTEVPGVPQVRLLEARFADLMPETRLDATLGRTAYTGLENAEMFVAHVDPGTPADLAGLRRGDLITAVDGQVVKHWALLDQKLLSDPGRTWTISWRRTQDGKVVERSAQLTQVWRKELDQYGHTVERLVLGARNDVERGQGKLVPIDGRFGYAVSKAVERTGETIALMAAGFAGVLKGDKPSESLGGPLTMYRVASVSGEQGWDSFLLLLALISVNLGLLNLLPVPVLDGGHVVVFAIEAVRRRPLSDRARERIQSAGLALIGLITLLALTNDLVN